MRTSVTCLLWNRNTNSRQADTRAGGISVDAGRHAEPLHLCAPFAAMTCFTNSAIQSSPALSLLTLQLKNEPPASHKKRQAPEHNEPARFNPILHTLPHRNLCAHIHTYL